MTDYQRWISGGLAGLILLLVCLWLFRDVSSAAEPLGLKLGVPHDLYDTVEASDLEPLRTHLEGAGLLITPVVVENAQVLADQLMAGSVDIGIFSPVAYVRQHRRHPLLMPFVTHVINGMRYQQGYVVVRQDSTIQDLAGLKGRKFAYTEPEAFGGFLFPRYALLKANLPMDGFFSQSVMTGDYLESLRQVYQGEVDGAAVLDEVLRLGETAQMPRASFRVIAKSRRVPYIAYVARPSLPPETLDSVFNLVSGQRFKRLYLRTREEALRRNRMARYKPRATLQWKVDGFVSVSAKDFEEVDRMLRAVETSY